LRALGQDESVLRPAPAANCRAALVAGANQSARRQCRGGQSKGKTPATERKTLTEAQRGREAGSAKSASESVLASTVTVRAAESAAPVREERNNENRY